MLNLEDIPVAHFPDSHKHLIVPDDFERGQGTMLRASVRNFDDLFLIAQAKQIFPDLTELYINYLLAARADRSFGEGEAFDLEIVANFINSLGFEKVMVLRPHSIVAEELINYMQPVDLTPVLLSMCEQEQGLPFATGYKPFTPYGIVIPDKGATPWVSKFVGACQVAIQCEKQRDMTSDHRVVSKIVVPELPEGVKDYVIVDDLCDGGGTFLGIASQLRERGAERVFLVITHAIFSKGVDVFDGLIDKVYCTNSFADFEHENIYQFNVQ